MNNRYMSRQQVANKAEWEGGLLEFVFEYGVDLDDLPEGDLELREAFESVLAARPAIARLEALLPDPGAEDENAE